MTLPHTEQSSEQSATARHTPGPWVAVCSTLKEARDGGGFLWAHPNFGPRGWTDDTRVGGVYQLCDRGGHTGLPGSIEVSEANAHLIAAAPEMYEALQAMLTLAPDPLGGVTYRAIRERALAALAKAEGQ